MDSPNKPRVLLAVFAHPDDEAVVAPLLARYGREGADVYVAYATAGEHGMRDHFKVPKGKTLAEVRQEEAAAASRELGIKPPIFLGLEDGSLGEFTNPVGKHLRQLRARLQKVLDEIDPEAIITWGPDGGYGHPDHCLVHDALTELVQRGETTPHLFYFGIAHEQLKGTSGPFSAFLTTDARYLTVHVPFTEADLAAARRSYRCHQSQFTDQAIRHLDSFFAKAWSGKVSFRPWFGEVSGDDLFE
ncbi:MAG TPA: PIG-L family deacetylase [Terriglobales bacterium]|nr:PIG-L family deacetylase [Terriglobales bacterium]